MRARIMPNHWAVSTPVKGLRASWAVSGETNAQSSTSDWEASAQVAELSEGQSEFVAEPFVLLVQLSVGVPQGSHHRLV